MSRFASEPAPWEKAEKPEPEKAPRKDARKRRAAGIKMSGEERAGIQRDVEAVEESIRRLARRVRRAGTIVQFEFTCHEIELYSAGKGKTVVMALLGA